MASLLKFDIGDTAAINVVFAIDDVATDPGVVTLKVKDPAGQITSYVWLTDSEIGHGTTGFYFAEFPVDQAGFWYYRWEGTEPAPGSEEGLFYVRDSAFASEEDTPVFVGYATPEELARLLLVNVVDRRPQLIRVLNAAAFEINQELGDVIPLPGAGLEIVQQVNLDRAVEHWDQMTKPFGVVGLVGETGPVFVSRDTWGRHAEKLSFLKFSWGIA